MNRSTAPHALQRSQGLADRLYTGIVYLIAIGALVGVGAPLIHIVAASLSDGALVQQGKVYLWPRGFTTEAYRMTFEFPAIWRGYANSLFYVALGTSINLIVTMLAAFPMSRKGFFGRKAVMMLFTITLFFDGGLVPTYMVVMRLGLVDTIWAILLPGALGVWNMIIMRTFITSTIPEELYEATLLDGGGDVVFLMRVVLPLSKAVMAVMALMFAVNRWNSYFPEMIYFNQEALMPLQVVLRRILVLNDMKAGLQGAADALAYEKAQRMARLMKYALIVVSSVPVMLIYPLAQRYFLQGVMVGSIKG